MLSADMAAARYIGVVIPYLAARYPVSEGPMKNPTPNAIPTRPNDFARSLGYV
jgi:hypothetical protein